jgi:hypothetical protein
MLTPDGKPREELWVEDRIHPNHDGYLARVKIMRPLLLHFIRFVMTARRAVITKWIKSAFQVKSARKADFVSLPKQEWEYLISCLAAAV